MNKTRTISVSQEKAGRKSPKGFAENRAERQKALGCFKRISETTGILAWREGRRNYLKRLTDEQCRQFENSIEDYHPNDEGLKSQLESDRKSYEEFWDARPLAHEALLFDSGCAWLPDCKGLVVGMKHLRQVVLHPSTAKMLMLLTEDVVGYLPEELGEIRYEIQHCYEANYADVEKIVPALHENSLSAFLSSLDGFSISNLILGIGERMEFTEFKGTDAIAKISRVLLERNASALHELAAFCAVSTGYGASTLETIELHGGEDGTKLNIELKSHLYNILNSLQGMMKHLWPKEAE